MSYGTPNYGSTGTTGVPPVNGTTTTAQPFSSAHHNPLATGAPGTGVGGTVQNATAKASGAAQGFMWKIKNLFYKCMPFLNRKRVGHGAGPGPVVNPNTHAY